MRCGSPVTVFDEYCVGFKGNLEKIRNFKFRNRKTLL